MACFQYHLPATHVQGQAGAGPPLARVRECMAFSVKRVFLPAHPQRLLHPGRAAQRAQRRWGELGVALGADHEAFAWCVTDGSGSVRVPRPRR